MKRVHIRVGGVVQGVCFRYYALREAGRTGVSGWVRNTPDGCVEAVIEGEDSSVDGMIAWFRRGPQDAVVDEFHSSEERFRGEFEGFRVVP
jgi:acylphosphatase